MKKYQIKTPTEQMEMISKVDGKDFSTQKEIFDYLQYVHSIIGNQATAINSAVYQLSDYVQD